MSEYRFAEIVPATYDDVMAGRAFGSPPMTARPLGDWNEQCPNCVALRGHPGACLEDIFAEEEGRKW